MQLQFLWYTVLRTATSSLSIVVPRRRCRPVQQLERRVCRHHARLPPPLCLEPRRRSGRDARPWQHQWVQKRRSRGLRRLFVVRIDPRDLPRCLVHPYRAGAARKLACTRQGIDTERRTVWSIRRRVLGDPSLPQVDWVRQRRGGGALRVVLQLLRPPPSCRGRYEALAAAVQAGPGRIRTVGGERRGALRPARSGERRRRVAVHGRAQRGRRAPRVNRCGAKTGRCLHAHCAGAAPRRPLHLPPAGRRAGAGQSPLARCPAGGRQPRRHL